MLTGKKKLIKITQLIQLLKLNYTLWFSARRPHEKLAREKCKAHRFAFFYN
jgi:hypothetical protein